MTIYSLPTPFYIDRPIDHSLMEKTICAGLQKLEACEASLLQCLVSTAHLYFSEFQQCIEIPLLNSVATTLDRLPKSTRKITILGTRPTIESGLYKEALKQTRCNLEMNPSWQKKVDELILSIKSSAPLKKSINLWEELSEAFQKTEIDTIILACTDLNVLLQIVSPHFQVVDSSLCLAEAVVKKWEERL